VWFAVVRAWGALSSGMWGKRVLVTECEKTRGRRKTVIISPDADLEAKYSEIDLAGKSISDRLRC
jgi:hypothetical protein